MSQTFECGVCGAETPANALACPECGADAQTGLYGDESGASLNLPGDDNFDYDRFTEREFGLFQKRTSNQWIIGAVAALVVIAVLVYVF